MAKSTNYDKPDDKGRSDKGARPSENPARMIAKEANKNDHQKGRKTRTPRKQRKREIRKEREGEEDEGSYGRRSCG